MDLDVVREASRRKAAGESVRSIAKGLGVAETTLRQNLTRSDVMVHDGLSGSVDLQEIPVIVRDYRHLDWLRVYPLGDVHLGATMHAASAWEEWLQYLVDHDDTSLLFTGDALNSAIIGSVSDVYEERMTVSEARRLFTKQLAPLAEKNRIDVLQPGNHENRITRAVGIDPIEDVAEFLGVPYAPAMAMLIYLVGNQEYHVLTRHGTGSGQSLAALAKSGRVALADVHVTGHVHRMGHTVDHIFLVKRRKLVRHEVHFVSSGAFLLMERYALERGFPPSKIGAPRISLSGTHKDVKVSM